MKVVSTIVTVFILAGLLSACGEDPEKEKFRKALVEKALNDDTRKAGDAFLLDNAKLTDIHVTASGLQYRVLQAGEGASPKVTDVVTVHYEGKRIDGVVFDSSYAREKPNDFPVNRVIRGWTEALSMMNKGAVWELFIPSPLAYGATSPNELIPANSTLVFKVELIDFKASE